MIVDNKPGAGTLVGAEFVAKQPADGYTLLMATSTTLGISPALVSAVADQSAQGLRTYFPSRLGELFPDRPSCNFRQEASAK